jgi:glycosyltransferase involved in cell wall biosynthesis
VVELEWGADTDRFRPGAPGAVPFERQPGDVVVVFAGAFRAWHGAVHLVEAMRRLERAGNPTLRAVLAGDGPQLARVRDAARGLARVAILGSVDHDAMPPLLAAADIGAAPFDVSAHPPLSLAFYWSPLKIFEYMASGLPVVAPDIEGIRRIVTDGEGVLYDPADAGALARALEQLQDAASRRRLGAAARARAVNDFSWTGHCRHLEAAMEGALGSRRAGRAAS